MKRRGNYSTLLVLGVIGALVAAAALVGNGNIKPTHEAHAQQCHYSAMATGSEELGMNILGPTYLHMQETTAFEAAGPYQGRLEITPDQNTALGATENISCDGAGQQLNLTKGSGPLALYAKNCSIHPGEVAFSITMPDECRRNASPPGISYWGLNMAEGDAPLSVTPNNNANCDCSNQGNGGGGNNGGNGGNGGGGNGGGGNSGGGGNNGSSGNQNDTGPDSPLWIGGNTQTELHTGLFQTRYRRSSNHPGYAVLTLTRKHNVSLHLFVLRLTADGDVPRILDGPPGIGTDLLASGRAVKMPDTITYNGKEYSAWRTTEQWDITGQGGNARPTVRLYVEIGDDANPVDTGQRNLTNDCGTGGNQGNTELPPPPWTTENAPPYDKSPIMVANAYAKQRSTTEDFIKMLTTGPRHGNQGYSTIPGGRKQIPVFARRASEGEITSIRRYYPDSRQYLGPNLIGVFCRIGTVTVGSTDYLVYMSNYRFYYVNGKGHIYRAD